MRRREGGSGYDNMVSTADDLTRFFHALLSGRLLPPALLAEMKTPVEIVPGFGYGLGLEVSDSPCGTLFGHGGGIMGYMNLVLNSEDGEHQFGTMINASAAPPSVFEPFNRVIDEGLRQAFAGEPCAAADRSGGVRHSLIGDEASSTTPRQPAR